MHITGGESRLFRSEVRLFPIRNMKRKGETTMIQIFGKSKCFDTRKAERYFKERRIPFQRIDLAVKGFSRGELRSVIQAVGSADILLDPKQTDAAMVRYLLDADAKLEKLLEHPMWIRTPVVRNGRWATVGVRPEIWKDWGK